MKRLIPALVCLALAAGCAAPPKGPMPAQEPAPAPAPTPPQALSATEPLSPKETSARFPGRLAYARDGQLFLLDGATGREVNVGYGGGPSWSHDGQWLAFSGSETKGGPYSLRLVRPDGSGLVTFSDLPQVRHFEWSPADLLLAVMTETGLLTVSPSGPVTTLVTDPQGITSVAWSPDGKQLAYSTIELKSPPPPADTVWTIPAGGGTPVKILYDQQNALYATDWWPDGNGLFYQVSYAHSASLAADGLPIMSVPLTGGAPKQLTVMLSNPRWISWAPDRSRFLATVGGGRTAWFGKSLAICTPQACEPIPQPDGVVSLDGIWSPDGGQVAFVRAESRKFMDSPEGWLDTRTLWVAKPDGTEPHPLKNAGTAILAPTWISPSHLLYARANRLWVIDTMDGPPQAIAEVNTPDQGYYGQVGVSYAWHK